MENNNLEELLVLYALGELEPDEASAVEEELQKRPELAAQVDKMRRTDGLLSDVFAQSDEAAQQELAKESVKPKVAHKTETSRRLARRFAFTSAALALFFVLVALLYPQFVKNDVQVAMTPNEKTISNSIAVNPLKNESAPAAEEQVLEEAQEEIPLFALDAMDDAEVAAEVVAEEAGEDIPPAAAADADMAEDDMEILPAAPNYAPLNTAAPAAAPPMEDNVSLGEAPAVRRAMKSPEPEDAHAQYYMKNALYDIPSQKTADGMAPVKGEIPQMKEGLLQDSTLGEMAVDQMNKRLESQRKVQAEKSAFKKSRQKGITIDDQTAPTPGSYVVLQKSVMEGNRLPNPESVKVEQWLNYFGVAELVKTTEGKKENVDDKDAQFVKAVNQFAAALSSPEPVDVKAFEEVLALLKDSVGDDAKRLEFKTIVEKTIEIKKKSE